MATGLPSFNTRTTALLATSIAAVLSVAVTHLRATAATAAKSPESDDDQNAEPEKPYEVKREHYSPATGRWEARTDDDDGAKGSVLFTVKHRVWPKGAEFQGHQDYTCVEVHSKHLIGVLRLELKEVEEAFEDHPELDAQDIFLHIESLRVMLAALTKEAATLKEAKTLADAAAAAVPTSTPEPVEVEAITSLNTNTEVKAEEVDDDDERGLIPDAPRTAEEAETEAKHLAILITYTDELFHSTKGKLERLLRDGVVSFALLWAIFSPGNDSYVEATDEASGEKYAFKIKTCVYSLTRDGLVFQISGTRIIWTGTRYARTWVEESIAKFKGMRKLASLPVHPLTDQRREALTARGRIYTSLARVAFMSYSGSLIQVTGSGSDRRIIKLRAEGRAVVDVKGYRRLNPSQNTSIWDDEDGEDDYVPDEDHSGPRVNVAEGVVEKELCLLPPCVFGFSLVQREWGEMRVDQFTQVIFNDSAYDYLVMDSEQKDLIRSLVAQNSKASIERVIEMQEVGQVAAKADFVAGKGGGLVVALHGRPGTGKTLTAEAIAELLHVPLYAIGAGELGANADVLEKRLRDVLDVGGSWGAVLLIDEADVFLEERSLHDVSRNAMVSVFLRLLEYHSGVLILTTNQIRTVDPAFLSRFSLAITYPDLSAEKRRQIWTTFLERAGARIEERPKKANGLLPPTPASSGTTTPVESVISAKYLDRLAAKTFNGRSIKNTVRTATALAASKGLPISQEHLDIVVKASETFLADVREPDEDAVYDASGEGWKSKQSVYS